MEDLNPDDWYQTVRRAAPFADLDRSVFDSVLGMLTGAYDSEAFTAFRPSLMWNHEEHLISARPGAQRLAVTSGGIRSRTVASTRWSYRNRRRTKAQTRRRARRGDGL